MTYPNDFRLIFTSLQYHQRSTTGQNARNKSLQNDQPKIGAPPSMAQGSLKKIDQVYYKSQKQWITPRKMCFVT